MFRLSSHFFCDSLYFLSPKLARAQRAHCDSAPVLLSRCSAMQGTLPYPISGDGDVFEKVKYVR